MKDSKTAWEQPVNNCQNCKGLGFAYGFDCVSCGGDGKKPTLFQIQNYAWRKTNRQKKPVTVADAMQRFKCSAEKIFKVVGFLGDGSSSPYFFIEGAPDMSPEKLIFGFDGE